MEQLIRSRFGIYWRDDDPSILMAEFPSRWTMVEVYHVLDLMADQMDTGPTDQVVVFDLTDTHIPSDAPQHFRQLLSSRVIEHHALRLVVVIVRKSRPVEVMVNIFNRLHQLFHDFPLLSVPTLPEALEAIARFRADN